MTPTYTSCYFVYIYVYIFRKLNSISLIWDNHKFFEARYGEHSIFLTESVIVVDRADKTFFIFECIKTPAMTSFLDYSKTFIYYDSISKQCAATARIFIDS
jgi:hypothetical protein